MSSVLLDTQVIVVGAGPVGLLLAGELRLGGADVVVIERLPQPTTESRASTLHARTMEFLDSRGLLEQFGELPGDVKGHFGGVPLDLTLDGPFPGQWKAPQTQTERILQQWAASLGVPILRGHEVTGLIVGPGRVLAEVTGQGAPVRVRSIFVVGCDGEQSTVRRLAEIPFVGRHATRELLRADVEGIDVPDRRFERLPAGLAIAARRADGVTRIMVHVFGSQPGRRDGPPVFSEIREAWRQVTGEDIGGGVPLWINSFSDVSRQAVCYRKGRILLAGDAAHAQMPIGGQALNLGLQDAANLGWKLALHVRGKAPSTLLDTYHTERHAVGVRVLGNIKAQATLLLGGPEVDATRVFFGELLGHARVRQQLAGMISGLDVRYDAGAGDDERLGRRSIPENVTVNQGKTSTSALLRGGRGLLVLRLGDPDRLARLRRDAAPWADRIDTVVAEAGTASGVLVRPDGYVAWCDDGLSGLPDALERWFGSPGKTIDTHLDLPDSTSFGRRKLMDRLAGKTALVTGASRGIGRAIAIRIADEGALVAVHYAANTQMAEDVVATIEKNGGRAFAVQAELGAPGDAHELFLRLEAGLKERTGSVELDVLVNNAGVMGGVPADETTAEQFDRLIAVNAKAPFFLIQRALSNLTSGARVINISSGLTRFANPDEVAYAMSKGAVEQLALHLAKPLAERGITINSVAPGITRNGNPVFDIPEAVEQMARLSPFGRVGEPQDVADIVAFLASDESRWMTGAFVDASGGTLLG
ncbi:monooxygenase [Amycolatopsis orientalis]|uniref:Monooxygenase n=1 Tax=Amycolatopsis orientalis TaxID=31958 RepID=A0A193BUI5_AMYOR|nr:SDR family oxidoreductase [Amycolatopsis orientalis]ANN15834.1 monooxygenase [Amycolatopsis orientalis]